MLPLRRSSTNSTRPLLLKGLDVVVDLLPSKPKPRRECGRGVWLGQLREHPSPHRIEQRPPRLQHPRSLRHLACRLIASISRWLELPQECA